MEVWSVSTGKIITIKGINLEKPVEYPKTWFSKNPGTKPIVKIARLDHGVGLTQLRNTIYKKIGTSDLKLPVVLRYFYEVFKLVKVQLNEDWISYNLLIGKKNENITPLDILKVEEDDKALDDLEIIGPATEADDLWLIILLCSFYKIGISESSNLEHKEILKILKRHGCKLNINFDCTHTYKIWYEDINYSRMIAAIDMFFNRFDQHFYAPCRYGTLPCRYRGCAALLAHQKTAEYLGISNDELGKWYFTRSLFKEFKSIFNNEEEYCDPYSYFVYQMGFKFCNRSPYSAKACQAIYFVCNTILALMGEEKPLRTKNLLEIDIAGNRQNACVVAYIFYSRKNETGGNRTDEPKTLDPIKWLAYSNSSQFKMNFDFETKSNYKSRKKYDCRIHNVILLKL